MEIDPELDLVLTRTINAPRELLYSCWTTPEHLKNFFVPKPHKVTACTLDVRAGGACNTTFDVEGTIMENNGVYLEIIPNEKIVFTDTYTEGWKPAPEPFMTAIILFEDLGNGRTKYTAIARHRNKETAESHKKMGFYDGWGTVVDQLEAYAQGVK
ncbi:MAG: SRPBCC family protein [Cypionkella sp.]|nr:SRPBCC family protein [Cypionkella sp.]